MKHFRVFLLLACSGVCTSQTAQIRSGATVYIEPADGYETYLAAAIVKKHVPLIVVADKDKADYLLRSTVSHLQPNQPALIVNNNNVNGRYNPEIDPRFPSTSIALIDAKSSEILFAYSAGAAVLNRTSDRCAQHLKEFIEKSSKKKK